MTTTINVAREFTRHPGPRYRHQGNGSGQAFRDDQLIPAMKKNSEQGGRTRIDLDGTAYGYPIGWLEEVFGGAVRALGPEAARQIEVVGGDDERRADVDELMRDAVKYVETSRT